MTTSENNFTAEGFEAAFLAIERYIAEPQKSLLKAHYYLQTGSMADIARAAASGHYGTANLQYGTMCGLLAAELGYSPSGPRLEVIAVLAPEKNEQRHVQWTMKEPVAKALEKLNWV